MFDFIIDIVNGEVTKESRRDFADVMGAVKRKDGGYLVTVTPQNDGYRKTRYKYYFDCILGLAYPKARRYCGWNVKRRFRPVYSVENLHEWLKIKFNPSEWIDPQTGEVRTVGLSTTRLSDRDFLDEYQEAIMAFFSGEPFFLEFPGFDTWKELHERGRWRQYKRNFNQNL